MEPPTLDQAAEQAVQQVLGYLNFSSGVEDVRFLANLDHLARLITENSPEKPRWKALDSMLTSNLEKLKGADGIFADCAQVESVLRIIFDRCLPAYLEFHDNLLFHQSGHFLFNAFFVGRVAEAVLSEGAPWDNLERIVSGAIKRLNDFVGYRPVAVLENRQLTTDPHERLRPVPLFVEGAGVVSGPYQEIVQQALDILRGTQDSILHAAFFDPNQLHELAVDCRAYDFDHPVNKRPNYHFGQWDPDLIDQKGFYTRFVVQQVSLDALSERLESNKELPREELLFEAAGVLAGTILMASAVSGEGPGVHQSTVSLTDLLPGIARFRDEFYEQLMTQTKGEHAQRLQAEALDRQQPFGGARQHLNARLATLRASQLEHVHLAMAFARMGYPAGAQKQANVVPVVSARMLCQIDCCLTIGYHHLQNGRLEEAFASIPKTIDLTHRAIECGAIIDPWNILGFDANFSLFPAIENSVRDHRADDIVELTEQLFTFHSRLWSEASAVNNLEICEQVDRSFQTTATWWRQFAAHTVSSVDSSDAMEAYEAAKHVARALNLWHQRDASTGDIGFWAPHAEMFDSPRAYALVVDALIQRKDFVASMALLIHWLSNLARVPLRQGENSFDELSKRWLATQLALADSDSLSLDESVQIWKRLKKFFDYLEVNAESYWHVPTFDINTKTARSEQPKKAESDELEEIEEDDEQQLYLAAYEDVTYHDSTDDGVEGSIYEPTSYSLDALETRASELTEHLSFLNTVATMWRAMATKVPSLLETIRKSESTSAIGETRDAFEQWHGRVAEKKKSLIQLLDDVQAYKLLGPCGGHESLIEYDRLRLAKENLLDRIINCCVANEDAMLLLKAVCQTIEQMCENDIEAGSKAAGNAEAGSEVEENEDQVQIVAVFVGVLQRDSDSVRIHVAELINELQHLPLLYVPLARSGSPHDVVAARIRQQSIRELLDLLPKIGLIKETQLLLEAARKSERLAPVGHGAVTEFDDLFRIGYKSIICSIVSSSESWFEGSDEEDLSQRRENCLFEVVEQVTESMLATWLAHSQTLRLSVLEKVLDRQMWSRLVEFIKVYGVDLFTQRFFNLGNMRAILHQGVDAWLEQLEEDSEADCVLLRAVGDQLDRQEAVRQLTLILEAIIENFAEYRDYNSTTTQSDRGELLYTLLDFLRLRTRYDRVAWHLGPVIWSHEILVRNEKQEAAKRWRRSVGERIGNEPEKYLKRLKELQQKYAMKLPTVADRLAERFTQPMQIDRIRALVKPAMMEPDEADAHRAFELLEQEAELLTRFPTGIGLDVPPWLNAIEEEVDDVAKQMNETVDLYQMWKIEPLLLSYEEAVDQLNEMDVDGDDS